MTNQQNILIVNVNWLGDVLFSTPFLRAVKENYGQAHLAVLAVPRVRQILEGNPYVDEVIIFDERGKDKNIVAWFKLIAALRKKQFHLAFILKPSFNRTLILKLSGIKEIIGFDHPKNSALLTRKIKFPRKMHKVDHFLSIAEGLGLKISSRNYEFIPARADRERIEELFALKKIDRSLPVVVLNPGGNWLPKRWPAENWTALAKAIKKEWQVNLIITGMDKDKELAKKITSGLQGGIFDFTGETTLGELAALMQKVTLVISADSGPMHLAAAVGTKVIALFGPTCAELTGPYPPDKHTVLQKNVGCVIPCYNQKCPDYRCMKAITSDDVINAMREFKL